MKTAILCLLPFLGPASATMGWCWNASLRDKDLAATFHVSKFNLTRTVPFQTHSGCLKEGKGAYFKPSDADLKDQFRTKCGDLRFAVLFNETCI